MLGARQINSHTVGLEGFCLSCDAWLKNQLLLNSSCGRGLAKSMRCLRGSVFGEDEFHLIVDCVKSREVCAGPETQVGGGVQVVTMDGFWRRAH